MIRHLVLVKLDPATSERERDSVFAGLAALQDVVAGLRSFAWGPNVSPEQLGKGFTHAFTVDFEDAAARDRYLVHPAHKAAGGRLLAVTTGGLEGLVVLDFPLVGT